MDPRHTRNPPPAEGRGELALYLLFGCSGAAGLIYEVLWARYLALFVGSTGLAQVIVLATFMGGLAIGGHFLGRVADRVASPLKYYAYLELAIGVYALLFDRIFEWGRAAFQLFADGVGGLAPGLVLGKIAACVCTILIPSVLMGATLPALGRHVIRSFRTVGSKLAFLYFLNSLGAVAGCLLAGFYLIRNYGLHFSMVAGGALNIAVGVVALVLSVRADVSRAVPLEEARTTSPPMPGWVFGVLLASVGVSGAVSMMYEVAWIRLLTLVLGSSTYSFSLMLATFILGLSMGGFLLSRRKKPTGYTAIFGASEVAVGLTVLLSLPFYVRLPYLFNQVASSLSREPATFGLYQLTKFLLCAMVMFIPTVFQGITLPAATKVLARDVRTLGRRVGSVFAVNTLGTLLGVVAAACIGLPGLGIKGMLELAVGLNLLLGLVVLLTVRQRGKRNGMLALSGVAIVLVASAYAATMDRWDRDVLTAGTYRTRERIPSFSELTERARERTTVFYRDGIDATVAVQDVQEPHPERLLVINGKVDASTVGDLPTQKMLAHVPMLFHPHPRRVLVIGLGSGATVGSVLTYEVEQVDVVELSRDVIAAGPLFAEINRRYWEDPRARVVWEDAKTFLQTTDSTYDVIISEPTNPWIAGVAGLFSTEFFEACRKRLNPGGLFVQWVQSYEIEDASFYLILETFTRSYPYYTLWNPMRADVMLMGSTERYGPNVDRMSARMKRPAVAADLRALGMGSALPVLMLQMADFSRAHSHVRWFGAVHSDYFPLLEYAAPRGFYVGTDAAGVKRLDERSRSPSRAELWVEHYLRTRVPTPAAFREAYGYAKTYQSLFGKLAYAAAAEWHRRYPEDAEARVALASERPAGYARVLRETRRSVAKEGLHARYEGKLRCRRLYEDYVASRNVLQAEGSAALLRELEWFMAHFPDSADAEIHWWHGEVLFDRGQLEAAVASLYRAQERFKQQGAGQEAKLIETAILTCRVLLDMGDVQRAREVYRAVLSEHADTLEVYLLDALIRSRGPGSGSLALGERPRVLARPGSMGRGR